MANKTPANPAVKNYVKIGVIAAIVIVVAALGAWGISALRGGSSATVEEALEVVTTDAANAADLRIAVIRMDAIQNDAAVLKDLAAQRKSYEDKLRNELEKKQKELESEKAEIEKSQDVLSRDALQRRIVDYQNRVTELQRDLTERAQSVEIAFQKALNEVQEQHLNPIIEGVIAKKNLSMVIDGRFTRLGSNATNLDITEEVISALDKKVSKVKMDTPQGF
ncbi:MAG TPA: OmpH family outer membrane protein [Candidatus Enterousia intestinigallinarum]|uniref:OmpH family outer membrane protein n=1 Tax=Candidatus Enterousia intestinigallinarum TaxID=2840790 RepID=A0A9D1FFW7_9PROT|nr:OmpH family outer membrane protein [Candidatus Enterousia intestinigallinarum]